MDTTKFENRHIGITPADLNEMLKVVGVSSLDELINQTIPSDIRLEKKLDLPESMTEREFAEHISELASKNESFTSYIGMGWYDTVCPAPIQRNVFENPIWYTSYTPYQAEVSQGRLEALFNYQTVICELTGLPLANCSLLDEATSAAEAATMFYNTRTREQVKSGANVLFVDEKVFPSTLAVLRTRMKPQKIEILLGDYKTFQFSENVFGAIVQYTNSDGSIEDYRDFVKRAKASGAKVAVAADLMSLVLLSPPGEWGADVVFGSSQRFGIPMFFGGPSAAFFAAQECFKRNLPGRIIGLSKDVYGHPAYRLALQTREQHIKREKATSNICTAQALLAVMAGFYAVYHGPEGLKDIARRIHSYAGFLAEEIGKFGYKQLNRDFFDTLKFELPERVPLKKLQEINPENKSATLNYCVALTKSGRYDEAANMLFRLDIEMPDSLPVMRVLAWTLMGQCKYGQARKYYNRLLNGDDTETGDWLNAGYCEWLSGDIAGAVDKFSKFIKERSNNGKAYDIRKAFDDDTDFLSGHGISNIDMKLMADLIILEEV